MMPAVPREPGVGIATAGNQVGAKAARGASVASASGAGDGFGSVMTAAMAKAAPRTHSAGPKSGSSEHAAPDASAHPGEAPSGPARALTGAQKSTSKPMDPVAADKQVARSQAKTEAEKHLPGQVVAQNEAAATGMGASVAKSERADPAKNAAPTVTAGGGLPEPTAKDGAAVGVAKAEIARQIAGAAEHVTNTVTEIGKEAKHVAGPAGPAQKEAAVGQRGLASGKADAKASKPREKKDTGQPAGKSQVAAPMASPGLTAVAMAAQAAGTVKTPMLTASSQRGARDREAGGLAGKVAGKVLSTLQGKVQVAMVSRRAVVTAGKASGTRAAAVAAESAKRAPGSLAVAAGDAGGKGATNHGAIGASVAAGGPPTGAEVVPAAGGGLGGPAGAGHDARASRSQAGMGLGSSQAPGADVKSGLKMGSKSSVGGASGGTAARARASVDLLA